MFFEDLNTCHVTGNLTRDVELRYSPKGTAVANIRIGVNGRRKEGDEWVDKPNFFGVTCFGKDAENAAKYLQRGRRILVEGRLDWSEWEAKDGSGKRQGVQIIARRILYLTSGKRSEEEQAAGEQPEEQQQTTMPEEELAGVGAGGGGEDDIPF